MGSRQPWLAHGLFRAFARRAGIGLCLCGILTIALCDRCNAQDVEPRRWTHLPKGLNYLGVGYAYTEADISDNPALRLADVQMELSTYGAQYIRTFELFEKSARVEVAQAYQTGHWNGLLDGAAAATDRAGWSDTIARVAVNVYGAPPLSGREFEAYRAGVDVETIVGLGLAVHLPTGEYMEERLINLGSNRFTFRPQAGVVHNRGPWSMELTASAWVFTDNDDFFGGNTLENDPLYTLQAHLVHNVRPGLWAGLSAGYGFGAQSTINGEEKDDRKQTVAWAVSFGFPFTRDWGAKIGYIGSRKISTTGTDTESLVIAVSHAW